MTPRALSTVSLFATILGLSTSVHAVTIIDLGHLGGGVNYPSGYGSLNASGQVVGSSWLPNSTNYHAFRTSPNGPITAASDLGTLGGPVSYAFSINDSGQVVGYSSLSASGGPRAYRTAPNGSIDPSTDLGSLVGGNGINARSVAISINDPGQVVGYSVVVGGNHAFRTTPNGNITPESDLGTLGGSNSYARSINNLGQVAGNSDITGNGATHAYRTAPNGKITLESDLGTLGGKDSYSSGINDSGQVIGGAEYSLGSNLTRAYRTTSTGTITPSSDLGTLGGNMSDAFGINEAGQVVGSAALADDVTFHAFFVDSTGPMIDLNTFLPPDSGWVLINGRSINDVGQITGDGQLNGEYRTYLLTLPEPTTLSLLALGGLVILRRRRRF